MFRSKISQQQVSSRVSSLPRALTTTSTATVYKGLPNRSLATVATPRYDNTLVTPFPSTSTPSLSRNSSAITGLPSTSIGQLAQLAQPEWAAHQALPSTGNSGSPHKLVAPLSDHKRVTRKPGNNSIHSFMYREDFYITSLVSAIEDKQLKPFYPERPALQSIAHNLMQRGSVPTLRAKWNLDQAQLKSMVKLALYDVVVLVDDSRSMRSKIETGELGRIMNRIAFAGTLFDSNGIDIRFMNNDTKHHDNIVDGEQAARYVRDTMRGGLYHRVYPYVSLSSTS